MINLSTYGAVESAFFVKWAVPTLATRYISDYNTPVTIGADTYTNDGSLLGIGATQTEIKASPAQLVVGLSGYTTNAISNLLNYDIKGSTIEILRGFFDPGTHALLDLSPSANPVFKFKGIVTNYTIQDEHDAAGGVGSVTINLTCNSIVEVLAKDVNGRRTNPRDFTGEKSMDRVPVLSRSNFNFGAPK